MKSKIARVLVGFLPVTASGNGRVHVSFNFFRKCDIPGFVTWWPSDASRFAICD